MAEERGNRQLSEILTIDCGDDIDEKMKIVNRLIDYLASAMTVEQADFLAELKREIDAADGGDDEATALDEGRLIWRSWNQNNNACQVLTASQRKESLEATNSEHSASMASSSEVSATLVAEKVYLNPLGMSVLTMLKDPKSVAKYHAKITDGGCQILFCSYPSTLLLSDGEETTVWSQNNVTVARLLRQNLNAAVYVALQLGKRLKKRCIKLSRKEAKKYEKIIEEINKIDYRVTRPVLFFHADLGSHIYWNPCTIWREPGLGKGDKDYDGSSAGPQKMRTYAVFYQTYAKLAKASASKEHSEMFVKYRQTGEPGEPSGETEGLTTLKAAEPDRSATNATPDIVSIDPHLYFDVLNIVRNDSSGKFTLQKKSGK